MSDPYKDSRHHRPHFGSTCRICGKTARASESVRWLAWTRRHGQMMQVWRQAHTRCHLAANPYNSATL